MSIVAMKRMELVALISDREAILRRLLQLGCVEVTDVEPPEADGLPALTRADNLSDAVRVRMNTVDGAIKLLRDYSRHKKSLFTPRPLMDEHAFFDDGAIKKAERIISEAEMLTRLLGEIRSRADRIEDKRLRLLPWKALDAPLEQRATPSCRMFYGTCPAAVPLEALKQDVAAAGECGLFHIHSDKERHYLYLMCHPLSMEKLEAVLGKAGFENVRFDLSGTVQDNLKETERAACAAREEKDACIAQFEKLAEQLPALEHAYDQLSAVLNLAIAREKLYMTGRAFVMTGWAPAEKEKELEKLLSAFGAAYAFHNPSEGDDVPVALKSSALVSPINMVTEMYSLPRYGTVDPAPVMFPFFVLFFGFMYADIGYGAILLLLGLFAVLKLKPRGMMAYASRLLIICGVTTIFFGALFGSFFGDALTIAGKAFLGGDLGMKPLLFNPVEKPIETLILAIAFGGVHIVAGMLIKAYMLIRDRKYLDALMDVGSWFLLFGGIAVWALGGSYYWAAAGALALVLTQGRSSKNIFGKLLGGVASLYNITSYFSDVLSYLRLMALCLATAVIASVVNTMGAMVGAVGFVLVFLLGHAFNMGINLIGTYVHAARLQYLEFFSKFYESGGRPFDPLELRNKYVDVVKGENNL